MVPTLCATLGVKGHRPVVGTRDDKDLLHVFASVNCLTGRLHTNTLATRANVLRSQRLSGRRHSASKTRRMQLAFAAHLRRVARAYPAQRHPRVVLVIDNAPWHRGAPVAEALAENPHLELYRLPAYSPMLNVIERLWKVLRRRATHNRLFDTLADLKRAVRDGLRYFQTVRRRVMSLIGGCYTKRTMAGGT
jgi:transposase